ncbi:MAG: tRNA lysidine(34) synthetase TilS [Actinobacteria bacterium]|nr:tRNA lysidine(34) synthetase TilS [Actinomycetota bacterium]
MKWERERFTVIARVRDTMRRWRMFEPGDLVLAAVSGGVDSLVLLDVLVQLAEEMGISLRVFHVDHGVREGSSDDAEYVRRVAGHYGLDCAVQRIRLPDDAGLSPEERLREARYGAFHRELEDTGAQRMATGHTADDRVETLLLRLMTGTGPRAMGSIPPLRPPFARPLIRVWRREVEEYARYLPFPPRLDITNMDVSIPRNRIRHRLLPLLEEEYNPSVKRVLLGEAEMLAALAEIVDELSRECEETDVESTARGEEIDVEGLRSRPLAVRREVIAASLRRLGLDPGFDLVEDIHDKLLAIEGSSRLDLGPGHSARRVYDRIVLGPRPAADSLPDTRIAGEGTHIIAGAGLQLDVGIRPWTDVDPREAVEDAGEAWVDADRISFPLLARGVRPGDRFRPLGAPGTRKLQDFLVDEKIPREDRPRVVIIECKGEIVWVAGMRIAESFKVREDTARIAVLKIEKLRGGQEMRETAIQAGEGEDDKI